MLGPLSKKFSAESLQSLREKSTKRTSPSSTVEAAGFGATLTVARAGPNRSPAPIVATVRAASVISHPYSGRSQ